MIKALVIIKDAELAYFIGLVLHHRGYQVNLARDFASGSEQMALIRPDVLVISKRQAEKDLDAFYAMRATHDCSLLTIGDSPGSAAEARFRTDLLPFPFGVRELLTRLEKIQRESRSVQSEQHHQLSEHHFAPSHHRPEPQIA